MSAIVTLIPAYKTEYIGELFSGLRTQKFKDFRVVLGDDSPGGEITERIRAGVYGNLAQELNLLVVRGPCEGAHKNFRFLIEGWGNVSPLVHVHLDDDVIYPDFYRAHAEANACGTFSASVSLRWVTEPDGCPVQDLPLPTFLKAQNAHIVPVSTEQLFGSTVPNCENWIGELSNVVLGAECAKRYLDLRMAGLSYYGLGDIGLLLDVSRQAPVAVIRDHLSGFRTHPQQTSAQLRSFPIKCGHIAWIALGLAAWREGWISPQQAAQSLGIALHRSARLYAGDPDIEPFFSVIENHAHDLSSLADAFTALWATFLESHPYSSS
jgi:hypothetical protein